MLPMPYTRTFSVFERDGYRIVDIEASVVTWGGSAGGPVQRKRLVLAAHDLDPPPLTGDLAGATLIRTPVMRIAVNDQKHEALVRALGIADRLVAVGGHESFDDEIRARVSSGEIFQIDYGWHRPPTLDALVAAEPDVLFSQMADLTHTQHLERVESLGIPVLPVFIDAEPHYMGRVDWISLTGILTGREERAKALVDEISDEIRHLRRLAESRPRRSLLWAWYRSSRDRWAVTQRNADAALIRDANVELVLGEPDDPELDSFSHLGTERLLADATDADCWMIRDPISMPVRDRNLLRRFKATRDGCIFWQHGVAHRRIDSWEIWEMGHIRPDWLLEDIVKMVHPELRDGHWRYVTPEDEKSAADAG